MNLLNPSIFTNDNKLYCLIRQETDVINWNRSNLSYILCKMDDKLDILEKYICNFKIGDNIYENINRNSLNNNYYCIEDIKIYKSKINNEIIGISNILIQQNPRIFRCGIIKLILETNTIELVKILEVDNMHNNEKNWALFDIDNNYYIIYKLFPELIIYTVNTSNYVLKLYKRTNIFEKINKSVIVDNLHQNYRNMYLTCSCIINNKSNFTIISKSRKKNNFYEYYKLELDFYNLDITIDFKCLFSGEKCYLNDVKVINENVIECWGINDKTFNFINKVFTEN